MDNKGEKISAKRIETMFEKPEQVDVDTLAAEGQLKWYYGTISSIGYFTPSGAGGREIAIQWDAGYSTRKQGGISDQQWEIFKLAFAGSGRIIVISDKSNWYYDYRYLEAKK